MGNIATCDLCQRLTADEKSWSEIHCTLSLHCGALQNHQIPVWLSTTIDLPILFQDSPERDKSILHTAPSEVRRLQSVLVLDGMTCVGIGITEHFVRCCQWQSHPSTVMWSKGLHSLCGDKVVGDICSSSFTLGLDQQPPDVWVGTGRSKVNGKVRWAVTTGWQ